MNDRNNNKGLLEKLPEAVSNIATPFADFIKDGVAGSVLLMFATFLAVAIANSPLAQSYTDLLSTPLGVVFGDSILQMSLRHWINDGLMALFFSVIGLEIKRELLVGELRHLSRSLIIIMAAIGGMVVPAALFVLFNIGNGTLSGWGIPMATDAAFAIGILALLKKHVPAALTAFLIALAIIDDLGAVLVITLFYTNDLNPPFLFASGFMLGCLLLSNFLGIRHPVVYLISGFLLWLFVLGSGIHASVSGILLAMAIPARPAKDPALLVKSVDTISTQLLDRMAKADSRHVLKDSTLDRLIDNLRLSAKHATTPLQDWERDLEKPVNLLILPLFALANAGIVLNAEALSALFSSELALGIIAGLLLGKVVGITAGAWLVLYTGYGKLPEDMNFRHVLGISLLGGVGFTMSIFIATLGFTGQPETLEIAKTAVLMASLLAGVAGYLWLRFFCTTGADNTHNSSV